MNTHGYRHSINNKDLAKDKKFPSLKGRQWGLRSVGSFTSLHCAVWDPFLSREREREAVSINYLLVTSCWARPVMTGTWLGTYRLTTRAETPGRRIEGRRHLSICLSICLLSVSSIHVPCWLAGCLTQLKVYTRWLNSTKVWVKIKEKNVDLDDNISINIDGSQSK